jgi:ATP-dependent DNA helicase RecQ
MRAIDREDVQERFMTDQIDVVVATTAFGMGIDKPNVRFVIHADVPESLDAYYQEIGRAGRDGAPAATVLFYRTEDLGLRNFFSSASADPIVLERVAKLSQLHDGPLDVTELRKAARLSATRLTTAVNLLEDVGALRVDEHGRVQTADAEVDPHVAALLAVGRADEREMIDRSRVEMVRGFAETSGCRRTFLLGYFGEAQQEPCGNCDTCDSGTAEEPDSDADAAWQLNTRVVHAHWGPGVVMRCEPDRVTVLFETAGYKTLKLNAVRPMEATA